MTAAARRMSGHSLPYQAAAVVAGVVALAAASRVSIPIGPVPITLQTFALFVLAGVFGGEVTLAAVAAWLIAAAFGLPVLAGGAHGLPALTGASLGFLAGMAVAAYVAGKTAERSGKGWLALIGIFLLGHAIVLAGGWAGLLLKHFSMRGAFDNAVLPYLPGAAAKSLAAAAVVKLVSR